MTPPRRRLATLALAIRRTLVVPGGPLEGLYQRLVRPLGTRLLPPPPRAVSATVGAWPSPPHPAAAPRSILLLKLDHIGDFLLAAPAFALLRRGFPDAAITLLCGPWNTMLAERAGYFDTVIPFAAFATRAEDPKPALDRAALAALGPFDLAIDLRVDTDTRRVLTHIRAARKAGYQAPGVSSLVVELPQPDPVPAAAQGPGHHQRQLLLNLAAAVLGREAADETAALLRRIAQPSRQDWPRPLVALAPGSGRAIKNWPIDRFTALARRLQTERGATIALLGGADLAHDAAAMRAALAGGSLIDLTGQLPIDASFGVLAAADAFIGNDSALGHAAASLGIPTLILFSGIDPLPRWAPLGPNVTILKAEIACAPCHLTALSKCPNAHLCMTAITVEDVWRHLPQVLGAGDEGRPGGAAPWTPAGVRGPQAP